MSEFNSIYHSGFQQDHQDNMKIKKLPADLSRLDFFIIPGGDDVLSYAGP